MLPEPSPVLSAPRAVGAELPWGVPPVPASPGWALQGWAAPAGWREDVLDQTSQTQLFYLQGFDFCGVTLSLCEVSSPRQAPSAVVWLFGTSPSPNPPVQTHPGLLMCPAGPASASPPALFFRPPLCLQPPPPPLCQVCAVLVVPGEFFPICCWCGRDGAVHGHTSRAWQGQCANPSSFQTLWKGQDGRRSPVWLQSRDFQSWNHIL